MGLQPGWITSTRFPSGADGQKVGAAALYVAVAKAAGPDKWREMNEQSLDMYQGVPGVVRLDTEFGATMLIPTQHLEEEITRVVTNQAPTLRPSLIVTTNCNPSIPHGPIPPSSHLPSLPSTHARGRSLPIPRPASPRRCGLRPAAALSRVVRCVPHTFSKGRTPVAPPCGAPASCADSCACRLHRSSKRLCSSSPAVSTRF